MEAVFSGRNLAVFTALAPCGATCFLLLALWLCVRGLRSRRAGAGAEGPAGTGGKGSEGSGSAAAGAEGATLPRWRDAGARTRFDRLAFVPVAVVWAGFIAAAALLGTPANALYVVDGVGRSPLSNEVVATVAFLFFGGVYWLYSFRIGYSRLLAGVLLALACASAVACVGFMSVAYDVETVPSWDSPYSAWNLVLTGVFSGASLAVAGVRAICPADRAWAWAFLVLSAAALAAGTASMLSQAGWLAGVSNNVATAIDGAPAYRAVVFGHAALGAAGLGLQAFGLRGRLSSGWRAVAFCIAGFALVMAAALMVRFPFYAFYLSSGF